MQKELAQQIVEYVESSNQLIGDFNKQAADLKAELDRRQFSPELLKQAVDHLVTAGLIEGADAEKTAEAISNKPDEALTWLLKSAGEKTAGKGSRHPVLGRGVGASKPGGEISNADRALLERLHLPISGE